MDGKSVTCPDMSSGNNKNDKMANSTTCCRVGENKVDKCIMIKGKCCGRPVSCFIDTGSTVSIISISFVKFMKKENDMEPSSMKLKAFSGDQINIYGQINFPAELAGTKMNHKFQVADFQEAEILMGMDIISEYGITIDAKNKRVFSEGDSIEFRDPPKPVKRGVKVICDKTIEVPPFSGTHITGKLLGQKGRKVDLYGQMEPYYNTMAGTGIMIAHSLVNSRDGTVPVRVINTTDRPVKLSRRTLLGQMKPVDLGEPVMRVSLDKGSKDIDTDIGDPHIIKENVIGSRVREHAPETWTRHALFEQLKLDELKIGSEEINRLKEVCWEYQSIFSTGDHDIGRCNFYEARLELKENYKPRWVPSRPIPYKHEQEVDRQIRDLIDSGVVEECHDHSNFNSPIFLVPKGSQKESWRMVCDLRQVNLEIKDEFMELTNLNHILDRVGDKNLYSTMDLSKSFHQVPYSKDSRFITAFMYKGKQYHFKRMIMGCKTSSGHLTRAIMMLLSNMPIEHVAYFVDDILLFTKDIAAHIDLLAMVFERILQGGMKLTPKKCHFLREEVVYTGITLTSEGVKMNNDRVEAITKLQRPINKPELQSVMGIFNYSKKFVKGYSDIARPLYRLLRKSATFDWSKECQNAFDRLKEAMVTAPVLAFPDVEDPHSSYEVQLDGSKWAYGATLTQHIKGRRRVIAYFSRQIQEHKKIWPQTQLEFETLYQTLKYFKLYLRGVKQFRVLTDCLPLLNITKIFSKMSTSVIRKLQELANYRFTIAHVSGKENSCADALSRYSYQSFNRSMGKGEPPSKINRLSVARYDHQTALRAVDRLIDHYYNIKYPHFQSYSEISRVENTTLEVLKKKDSKEMGVQIELPEIDIEPQVRLVMENEPHVEVKGGQPVEQVPEVVQMPEVEQVPEVGQTPEVRAEKQVEFIIPPYLFENDNSTPCYVCFVEIKNEREECNCHLQLCNKLGKFSRSLTNSMGNSHSGYDYISHHVVNSVSNSNSTNDSNSNIYGNLVSKEEIKRAQEGDDIISKVLEWVKKGEKPKSVQVNRCPKELLSYWKQFSLLSKENGLLKRKWHDLKDRDQIRELVVIPCSLQETVMDKIHSGESCHAGIANTLELCRRHFYWPQMEECIKLWVGACYKCAATKAPTRYAKAPLQHILFHTFNDGIVIDHIEPEKVGMTTRRNKFILSITDCWSNFMVAVPTRTQNAEESISLIRRMWVERFGMPHEVMADNHPSFKSKFFKTVLAAFDCKLTHGQPYVSRTTGRAERSNRRINMAMRAALPGKCYKDWDLYLGRVVFSLNCLKNRHTGYSSNFLVFGRELNTPLSILAENRKDFELEPIETGKYDSKAWEIYKNCKEITRRVRRNAKADFCYSQRYHDKNLKGPYFEEGEEVFILIQCPSHKFGPRWVGPYKITRKISDHLYVITLPGGEEKTYNIGKLKKYVRNKYSPKPDKLEGDGQVGKATGPKSEISPQVQVEDSDSDSDSDLKFVDISNRNMVQPRPQKTPNRVDLFPQSAGSGHVPITSPAAQHNDFSAVAATSTPRSSTDAIPEVRSGTPRASGSIPNISDQTIGSRYHSVASQDNSLSTVDLSSQNTSAGNTVLHIPTPPRRSAREKRAPDRYGCDHLNSIAPQGSLTDTVSTGKGLTQYLMALFMGYNPLKRPVNPSMIELD